MSAMVRRGCWIIGLGLALPPLARAGVDTEEVIVRGGTGTSTAPHALDYQALALRFALNAHDANRAWMGNLHLDIGVGHTSAFHEQLWLFTLGPVATFRHDRFQFELGTAPTLLSRIDLDGRQFGGRFQFTTHIAAHYRLDQHWRLGYRLQHTSNGGLYSFNDGLNLQMADVGYVF